MSDRVWFGLPDLAPLVRPIRGLRIDPKNARLHNDASLKAIWGSLRRFGQTTPIVIDERTQIVRKGNGTLMAAEANGWTHIAVSETDIVPDEQPAYALADNRTGDLSKRNPEVVLAQLDELPPDLALDAGFSVEHVAAMKLQLENDEALAERRAQAQEEPQKVTFTYTIVFANQREKVTWDAWLQALSLTYPSAPTAGTALVMYLADRNRKRTQDSPDATGSEPLDL